MVLPKNQAPAASPHKAEAVLPEDLAFEVLTRLSHRNLRPCRYVCKSWLSIIRSPEFLKVHRSRHQHDLIRRFAERAVRYYRSTRPLVGPEEEILFPYGSLASARSYGTTEADGLRFIRDSAGVNLFLPSSGETVRLPDAPVRHGSKSLFSPGYDPASGMYKLLRLIMLPYQRLAAEILIIGNSLRWRELEYNSAGLGDLSFSTNIVDLTRTKALSPDDGFLYWLLRPPSLFSFDLKTERFRKVTLPVEVVKDGERGWRIAQSMGRFAVWVVDDTGGGPGGLFLLFRLEDEEGKSWRKVTVELPSELGNFEADYTVAVGSLPTGEVLLINPAVVTKGKPGTPVYSYDHRQNKFQRFVV